MKKQTIFFIIFLFGLGVIYWEWGVFLASRSDPQTVLQQEVLQLQTANTRLKQSNDILQSELEILTERYFQLAHNGSNNHHQVGALPDTAKDRDMGWRSKMEKCYTFADYSQLCIYNNICFDGKSLIYFEESSDSSTKIQNLGNIQAQWSDYDMRYYEPYPYPPLQNKYVPSGSSFVFDIQLASIPAHHFDPKDRNSLQDVILRSSLADSIQTLNGTVWFPSYDGSARNIWHFAAQNFPLWEAKLFNESVEVLPSLDYVVMKRDYISPGWELELLELFIQPHTKVLLNSWIHSPDDFRSKADFPAFYQTFLRTESDAVIQKHHSRFLDHPKGLPGLDHRNWMCADRAVVLAQQPRLFSGIYSSERFKQTVCDYLKIPLPPARGKYDGEKTRNSNRVVVYMRVFDRTVTNLSEVVKLLKYYKLDVIVQPTPVDMDSLRKQANRLWDADVLIGVHGAGLTNAMFLPYRAALIEVFPWGYRPPMYGNLANAMGLYYQGIQSWMKPDLDEFPCSHLIFEEEYVQNCSNFSMMDQVANPCGRSGKHACVEIPIEALELALLNAYDFLSENLHLRVPRMYSTSNSTSQRKNDWHDPHNFETAK